MPHYSKILIALALSTPHNLWPLCRKALQPADLTGKVIEITSPKRVITDMRRNVWKYIGSSIMKRFTNTFDCDGLVVWNVLNYADVMVEIKAPGVAIGATIELQSYLMIGFVVHTFIAISKGPCTWRIILPFLVDGFGGKRAKWMHVVSTRSASSCLQISCCHGNTCRC